MSFFVRALYDFTGEEQSALAFRGGDVIEVMQTLPSGWWNGICRGSRGWFPSNFVESIGTSPVAPASSTTADSAVPVVANSDPSLTSSMASLTAVGGNTNSNAAGATGGRSKRDTFGSAAPPNTISTNIHSSPSLSAHLTPQLQHSQSLSNGSQQRNQQLLPFIPASASSPDQIQQQQLLQLQQQRKSTPVIAPVTEIDVRQSASASAVTDGNSTGVAVANDWSIARLREMRDVRRRSMTPHQQSISNTGGGMSPLPTHRENGPIRSPSDLLLQQQHQQQQAIQQYPVRMTQSSASFLNERNDIMDDSGSALYALPDSTASNNISNGASSVNNIADGNNIEFDNNEDKYPPNWIRKLTIIRAKPYYVNLLADLSAWSLENVQSDTGLDERAADIAERCPAFVDLYNGLSESTLAPVLLAPLSKVGRSLYVNMVSRIALADTLTAPSNLRNFNNTINDGKALPRFEFPAVSTPGSSENENPATSVPLAGLATSIVNSDGNYTLDSLVSNVAYSLKRLGQSVYEGRRREYLSFSDAVVDAVRLLFEACGISDRHSAVLKMHRLLRAHHRGVSVALSQFVRHAKEASSLWSPPDAASRMMNDANEVLLNSRHFATLADECKVGVDTLAVARHVELKMSSINNQSNLPAYLQESGNYNVFGPAHHEAIIVSTQLETFAINLARAISLMLRFIRLGLSSDPAIKQQQQQQQQQQGGVNPENGVYSPTRLVAHAKHVVTEVGSFLAFVEQYDEEVVMNPAIGVVGSPAAADFSSSRQRVFRDVTSLVMAAQSAAGVGPSALTGSDNSINNSTANIQSEAVHPRVSAWASVESACETLDLALRDLVISFKKVIESRDMILYSLLGEQLDRFKSIAYSISSTSGSGTGSGLPGLTPGSSEELAATESIHTVDTPINAEHASLYGDETGSAGASASSMAPRRTLSLPFVRPPGVAVNDESDFSSTEVYTTEPPASATAAIGGGASASGSANSSTRRLGVPTSLSLAPVPELSSGGLSPISAGIIQGATGSATSSNSALAGPLPATAPIMSGAQAAALRYGFGFAPASQSAQSSRRPSLGASLYSTTTAMTDPYILRKYSTVSAQSHDSNDSSSAAALGGGGSNGRPRTSSVSTHATAVPPLPTPISGVGLPSGLIPSGSTATLVAPSSASMPSSSMRLRKMLGQDPSIDQLNASRASLSLAASNSDLASQMNEININDNDSNINSNRNIAGSASMATLAQQPGATVSSSGVSVVSTQSRPTDKPWYLNFDHEPNEIVFNSDGNIRGGTLRALIERLTAHEGSDTNFNTTVLLTYRTFTTTDVFLDLLISRYTITAPPGLREEEMRIWRDQKMLPIRLRVFNVMRTWLENYYIEAEEDGDALVKLKNFASTELANSKPRWAEQLIRAIDMRRHASDGFLKRLVPNTASNMPASILPRGFGQKKLKLLDIDPLELARQLTLAEFKIYGGIRFIEFLNQGWQTRNAPNTSANIKQMAERSTRFTNWVGSLILEESDLRRRANVVKYLITVGYHCLTLNNFSTLMSMNGALDSAPIGRLRRTWDQLPQRTLQQQEAMRKAMNPSRNSMAYRDALHSANPPCLPFLGIHLSDITFTDEGNQNMISGREGLINITKRSILSESIRDVLQYQNTPYRFNEVKEIQDYVATCLDNVDEMQDLYTRSLELEPREAEDAKIQRLLRESGFL